MNAANNTQPNTFPTYSEVPAIKVGTENKVLVKIQNKTVVAPVSQKTNPILHDFNDRRRS